MNTLFKFGGFVKITCIIGYIFDPAFIQDYFLVSLFSVVVNNYISRQSEDPTFQAFFPFQAGATFINLNKHFLEQILCIGAIINSLYNIIQKFGMKLIMYFN